VNLAAPTGAQPRCIRVIVVDDEPLSRSNLTTLLARDRDVELVAECSTGREALHEIRKGKPDLVFLDVEMPECDGFDVIEMLGTATPRAVVFVTAYDKYAVRAFETGALDYLLKPFDDARFFRALARAKERLRDAPSPAVATRLPIKSAHGISFLEISEIDWIEAADYYSRLHLAKGTHLLRRSMAELERELDPAAFCRIHRSTIVNVDFVRGLELGEHGDYEVVLEDGTRLRCSRRYRARLQSALLVAAGKRRGGTRPGPSPP
jgi:two-component system LytT family response regulator